MRRIFTIGVSIRIITKHGSISTLLCAKFRNDLATEKCVMSKRVFARFGFKVSFMCLCVIQLKYESFRQSSVNII